MILRKCQHQEALGTQSSSALLEQTPGHAPYPDDVVRGSVHVEVLDPHCQLMGSFGGQEVFADQRLRKLRPFEMFQP